MGNLYVEPESVSGWDPERVGPQYNWEYAGTARGDAAVPHDRNVQLVVRLGPRPGDSARLLAQNRLAHQMLVADGARVEPDDLSGLSGLGPDDLCWLAVSALVPRADADQRVLEPVRRLTGLQMLSLHTTGVTDKGMEYLRDLRSLKALELSGELSLGNTGMAVLKDLPALEYLDLDTGVTDAGLKQIGQLPNARWLRIRTGGFWGPGLAELAKLPRLERLCLVGEVGLSDRHLQYLESLLHLKSLTLWGGACDRLTDPSLASIGKLKDLEELNFIMTSPRFTPAGIAHLKDLKNLKKIDFAQAWSGPEAARYGDDVVRQLAALPGLESIKGVSYLSAEGMKVLAAFRNLRRLGIGLKDRHQGYHGPTGLSHLGGLSALEELSFTGGEALSEADLAGLESLSRLKVLSIMSSHLTDQSLASISKLERLEQLNLAGTRASRNGLNQLSGLKSLRGLDVQMWAEVRPTNVTDELALDLSKLQGLKRLRLSGLALQEADAAFLANLRHLEGVTIDASSLPGTSLRYLRGLSELEYLSVRGLSRPTGGDLAPLAGLANVKTLILGGEIADTALTSLDGLSGLQWLNVETAAPIRSQTIADLKQRLPMIEYIHISEPLPQPAVSSERPRVSPPRGNQPAPQSRRRGR
jgi:Leucine-rich repeat (LRR) protein